MHDGAPYIVSELLHGQTLRQRLFEGPIRSRQAGEYAIQIAQGLIAAHDKRIVHRDLKPENLFITRDGHVKILDFGIAKLTGNEVDETRSIEAMTTQTKAGSILGTVVPTCRQSNCEERQSTIAATFLAWARFSSRC